MRRPGSRLIIDAMLALAALAGLVLLALRDRPDAGVEVESLAAPPAIDRVVAHVSGAVAAPGIVTLPRGARVADAVTAAGGALRDADLDGVNLARRVEDEDRVTVPRQGDRAAAALIDLNRATRAELISLAGIGEVTAGRIIESRAGARFTSSDELVSRRLLSARDYEAIRDLVTARP